MISIYLIFSLLATLVAPMANAQTTGSAGWYVQGDAREVGSSSGKGMIWIKSHDAQDNPTAP